jgi:hypothetical protein
MKCLDRSEVNHVDRFDFERFRITLLKLLQAGGLTARSCDHLPTSSTVFFSKGQTEASGCAYHQDRLLRSHLKLSYLPVWRRRPDVIEYGFRVRAELSSSWLACRDGQQARRTFQKVTPTQSNCHFPFLTNE